MEIFLSMPLLFFSLLLLTILFCPPICCSVPPQVQYYRKHLWMIITVNKSIVCHCCPVRARARTRQKVQ